MSVLQFKSAACERIRRYLHSYVNNELMTETNHEVLRHLETCPDCAQELEALTTLKTRLKRAALTLEAPASLKASIQSRIAGYQQEHQRDRRIGLWAIPVAAALILSFGTWRVLKAPATATEAGLLRVGLADHVACAVPRKYDKAPPSRAEMESELGPKYKELLPVVQKCVPSWYKLEQAHRCQVNGREYVHFIFRNAPELVSVIVTAKGANESLANLHGTPEQRASGLSIYQMDLDRYETAATETKDDFVFVVSNLEPKSNLQLASILFPSISAFVALR